MSHIPEKVKLCLRDLVERLKKYRIRYVIVGAMPVHFYGRPRASADIDMVIVSRVSKEKFRR